METEAGVHFSNCSPVDGNDSGGCVIKRAPGSRGPVYYPNLSKVTFVVFECFESHSKAEM